MPGCPLMSQQPQLSQLSPLSPLSQQHSRLPLLAGVAAGLAASLCCVGPLLLLLLGISGAWISYLTVLEPLRPLFIGLSALFMVMAYRRLYARSRQVECVDGRVCARPPVQRGYRIAFWSALVLVLLSVASPYAMPLFY